MTNGINATYLPPSSPSRRFPQTASSAGSVDPRPQGTVAPQGGYALPGAGISPQQQHQYPFSAALLSSGPANAHYATWSHDHAMLDHILPQQMLAPQMVQGDASYLPQMPIGFTDEWAPASWSSQPPPSPRPALPHHSASWPPGAPTNVELHTSWTMPVTQPSSSLFGAVVPQPPSTYSSISTSNQSEHAAVPTANSSVEHRPAAAMYEGNSPVLTSRNYSSVGSYSAPSLALDRTLSLRSSRPHWEVQAADWEVTAAVQEAPEISPITGPSSTQRLEIVDRDEDMDDDGEADSEAANRFEVVERTRKRRPASGKVSQGKGKKRQPKMHTCSQCSKRFPRPSGLETHITSVHSGQKPYGCPVPNCNRFFAVRSNMTRHLKTHGAEGTDAWNRMSSQIAGAASSEAQQTGLMLGFQEPHTIPNPATWSKPINYKWIQVPGTLSTRTNISALSAQEASSSSQYGSSSATLTTQARLSTSPSLSTDRRGSMRTRSPLDDDEALLSMPTLSSSLPPVTPSPPNAAAILAAPPLGSVTYMESNSSIEERESYVPHAAHPYHPS